MFKGVSTEVWWKLTWRNPFSKTIFNPNSINVKKKKKITLAKCMWVRYWLIYRWCGATELQFHIVCMWMFVSLSHLDAAHNISDWGFFLVRLEVYLQMYSSWAMALRADFTWTMMMKKCKRPHLQSFVWDTLSALCALWCKWFKFWGCLQSWVEGDWHRYFHVIIPP